MFEKFNDSSRRVLFYARYEASQSGSPHIGSEHLLLGLLKETEDVVREIFNRCKVSIPELQARVETQVQRGERVSTSEEIPLHESCKEALTFSLDETKKLLHSHVGAEHLLLGLLRQKDSSAGGAILQEQGVQLYDVREHVVAILREKAVARVHPISPADRSGDEQRARKLVNELLSLGPSARIVSIRELVASLDDPLEAAEAVEEGWLSWVRTRSPDIDDDEAFAMAWTDALARILARRRRS